MRMHVDLLLDPAQPSGWHQDLVASLRQAGSQVDLAPVHTSALGQERMGAPGRLTIDLTGAGAPVAGPCWQLLVDGAPGTSAALPALSAGRFPCVQLRAQDGSVVAEARPGSENPVAVAEALQDVLAGVVTLVSQAVRGNRLRLVGDAAAADPAHDRTSTSLGASAHRTSRLVPRPVRQMAGTAARAAYRALYRTPHWRVGWRFVDGPDLLDLPEELPGGWRTLADDGHHFYADPFPIVVGGTAYLFVEDFDHRVGRGVISVTELDELDELGRPPTPRPVLRHDVHLSYPHVLADEGELWMIPETSEAGTVELYRAARFPDRWVRERVLIEGVEASDATPFRHEGRWWLAATVRHGGSWSDTLHLWHAPHLVGPWQPHAANPVLLDIASARPAGRVVERGGRLLRPVQDCSKGYGAALAIAEITALDDDVFEQQVLRHFGPGAQWPGRRLHTANRAGRLECIDGSALSPRLW